MTASGLGVFLREHCGEDGTVDVATGLDHRDSPAGEAVALLQCRSEGRGAGPLGHIVRVGKQDPHRAADLCLGDGEDSRRAAADYFERLRVGALGRQARRPSYLRSWC